MKLLKGYYINLKESTSRRNRIEQHFQSLNINQLYEQYPAFKGTESEARKLNLSTGEVGLWKSWLGLLKDELSKKDEYQLLHILEDDARLSAQFISTVKQIADYSQNFDILATDMYVNPSVYRALIDQHEKLKGLKRYAISHNLYTGCTSSIIIAKDKIEKVYELLANKFNEEENLLPLDNYLRLAEKENKINIARMAPFTTTVELTDIHESTIQVSENQDKRIELTTTLCTILRQELFINSRPNAAREILKILEEIAETYVYEISPLYIRRKATELLLKLAADERLLKYKYKPNLVGQHDNPQQVLDE